VPLWRGTIFLCGRSFSYGVGWSSGFPTAHFQLRAIGRIAAYLESDSMGRRWTAVRNSDLDSVIPDVADDHTAPSSTGAFNTGKFLPIDELIRIDDHITSPTTKDPLISQCNPSQYSKQGQEEQAVKQDAGKGRSYKDRTYASPRRDPPLPVFDALPPSCENDFFGARRLRGSRRLVIRHCADTTGVLWRIGQPGVPRLDRRVPRFGLDVQHLPGVRRRPRSGSGGALVH
jgi:hypothetical protein